MRWTCILLAAALSPGWCAAADAPTTRPGADDAPVPTETQAVDRFADRFDTPMRRTESAHYVVLYDRGRVFAESRVRLAERTYKTFHETFREIGLSLRPIQHKLILVVLRDKQTYVRYARELGYGAEMTEGFYALADDAVVLFDSLTDPSYQKLGKQIDAQRAGVREMQDQLRRIKGGSNTRVTLKRPGRPPRTVTRKQLARTLTAENRKLRELEQKLSRLATRRNAAKTMHEAAHQLAVDTGVLPNSPHNPFWVSEGLACQFEVHLTASARKRGAFNRERLEAFRAARRGARLRPLGKLLTVSVTPDLSHAELLGLYAQAWGLFYYLRSDHPEALAAYLTALRGDDGGPIARPTEQVAAFKAHFGSDLRAIHRDYTDRIEGLE